MQQEKEQSEESFFKKLGRILKAAYSIATACMILVTLPAATYAWFSSNSVVKTDYVTGRSGTDQVELQVSQSGGDGFRGSQETALVQINQFSSELLMPVSTADLQNYVYNAGTIEEKAADFVKTQNERYIYHGRVYLRATSQGHSENAKLALYFDSPDVAGNIVNNTKGYIANAARLGVVIDGGQPQIFRLSEEHNPGQERTMNTVLGGITLTEGQVIDSSSEPFRATADPSLPLTDCTVNADGSAGGASPILLMELNRIYTADVYFYLEGCDPDCSDVTKQDYLDLHLAFYGVLTEGEVR